MSSRDSISETEKLVAPSAHRGMQKDPDAELMRRVGAGDHAAFEQLYTQYYHYLYRFIFRITRRLESIEEIINDVMFVVWQKAATLKLTSRTSTWLLGIAYRKSLKFLANYQETYETISIEEITHDLPSDREPTMEQSELADLLLVGLDSLSPEHRAVVELTYYYGMHYSQIAEIMKCPEGTIKTRMFHARKKLRSQLRSLSAAVIDNAQGPL